MSMPSADHGSAFPPLNLKFKHTSNQSVTTCYAVHAIADPGLLPRLIGVFAKRGLTPSRWFSVLVGPTDQEIQVDMQIAGLSPATAQAIAEEMRKIVMVSVVMMSDKIST